MICSECGDSITLTQTVVSTTACYRCISEHDSECTVSHCAVCEVKILSEAWKYDGFDLNGRRRTPEEKTAWVESFDGFD